MEFETYPFEKLRALFAPLSPAPLSRLPSQLVNRSFPLQRRFAMRSQPMSLSSTNTQILAAKQHSKTPCVAMSRAAITSRSRLQRLC